MTPQPMSWSTCLALMTVIIMVAILWISQAWLHEKMNRLIDVRCVECGKALTEKP